MVFVIHISFAWLKDASMSPLSLLSPGPKGPIPHSALLADNITNMRRILYRVDRVGTKAGLKLNAKKLKCFM